MSNHGNTLAASVVISLRLYKSSSNHYRGILHFEFVKQHGVVSLTVRDFSVVGVGKFCIPPTSLFHTIYTVCIVFSGRFSLSRYTRFYPKKKNSSYGVLGVFSAVN